MLSTGTLSAATDRTSPSRTRYRPPLFNGGPGATGRSYSDFDTIINSIRDRLLTLPDDTEVRTGHGNSTRIGAESPHLQEWIQRGS